MKAKFIDKQDNEYIKVESVRLKGFDHDVKPESLQFEDYTNWNTLRNQAAIAAMQGVMDFFGSLDYNRETIAEFAVKQADALIEELKKEKKD